MKWVFKKNKKPILFLMIVLWFIAGLLDIKYEGLFFQLLPDFIQSYLAGVF
ncbi:hypothetical protein M3221_14055 [Domibacillus indicus]|uniref:hypothetical protein n=1 Tax=Domibacillus indicus TaxID=1437523 RepID=UPI00203FD218|nr:hypothetical protein [Domibacillus indicus]MCM3789526.1 hypothetical protein [Domibacillus indicus]